GRLGAEPHEAWPQPGEEALALHLAEGDQAQPGADEQRRPGVEIRDRGPLGVGARAAQGPAEGDGMVAGRQAVLNGAKELGEEPIVVESGSRAERLAPHLAARGAELWDALYGVEPRVERHGFPDVFAGGDPGRVRHRHGVARARAPLEVGDDERLEARRVVDAPLLDVR